MRIFASIFHAVVDGLPAQTFANVSSVVVLYDKFSSDLIFENVCLPGFFMRLSMDSHHPPTFRWYWDERESERQRERGRQRERLREKEREGERERERETERERKRERERERERKTEIERERLRERERERRIHMCDGATPVYARTESCV